MSRVADLAAEAPVSVLRPGWAQRGYGPEVLTILYSGELALAAACARLQEICDERRWIPVEAARVVKRGGDTDVAIYVRTQPAAQQQGEQM